MRNTTFPAIMVAIFVLWLPASAQNVAPSPGPTPERPRAIVALLNDARLAAPELAVDTFLKVAESKRTDAVWRKEIVNEALRMIDDVQYPIALSPAYGGKVERNNELLDTEDAVRASAFAAKLDRLSLRGRAITLLLEMDPERAKQITFQVGGELGLKPRFCEDTLTYAPDIIYAAVADVAKATFTEQEIAEGRRALFVSPWVENISSPTQIAPALDLVQQLQGSPVERQILLNAISRAIDRSFHDDRSFTYRWDRITSRIEKLISGESDPQKSGLRNAYRAMLLKNLGGTRCKDNAIAKDDPLPDYVEDANKLLPDNPLTGEDVRTTDVAGTAKLTHILAKSSVARSFRDELFKVRDTKIVDNKVVNHDPTDVEWVSRVNEFTDRVLSMEGKDGETESEVLFLKSSFVGAILSGVEPKSDLRKPIVRKFLRLLLTSPLQKTSFIDWRMWITGLERMAPDSFDEIAAEFPNPNLKVMLEAKKLFPPPKPGSSVH